jgi:stearoyl-CoA desaturase (Delta-9 desaturase)
MNSAVEVDDECVELLPKAPSRPAALVFSSATFHRLQLRHFILFDALPLLGLVATLVLLPSLPPHAVDWALFAVLWLATGFGLSVGFHRYFSHRSFETTPAVVALLLVLGSMAARGSMISWVAMHRRHHQISDKEGDLHSPNLHGRDFGGRLRGFLHAHLMWMMRHDYPNVTHYVPDLLRDKTILRFNRHYYSWVALGLLLPALIGGLVTETAAGALTAFLWGGVVRLFVVEHTMSAINSVCHLVGSRVFTVRGDNSRNIGWLGVLSWGEAFHNNHHAFPSSAAFGLRPSELDPGFWLICLLAAVGLVWNVRAPSAATIARRQLAAQNG